MNTIILAVFLCVCGALFIAQKRSKTPVSTGGTAGALDPKALRDAAANAAAARASTAPAPAAADPAVSPAVKDALKAFNVKVLAMQDYLHHHPLSILDALELIKSIAGILIRNNGMNPQGSTQPYTIKASLFSERAHAIEHAYTTLMMLGFKETIVDMEKYLEFYGRFQRNVALNTAFLTQASQRLQIAIDSVEKHMQMNVDRSTKGNVQRQTELEAIRQQIESDRAARQEHTRRRQEATRARAGLPAMSEPLPPVASDAEAMGGSSGAH